MSVHTLPQADQSREDHKSIKLLEIHESVNFNGLPAVADTGSETGSPPIDTQRNRSRQKLQMYPFFNPKWKKTCRSPHKFILAFDVFYTSDPGRQFS